VFEAARKRPQSVIWKPSKQELEVFIEVIHMNETQRKILIATAGAVALMVTFPPS
jgi:hypothetical protein